MAVNLLDLGWEVAILPVNPDNIPYAFLIKLDDLTFKFTFKYNEIGKFFTVDLETIDGEILAYGDILRYGRPLFGPIEDERFPLPVIIPLQLNGNEDKITIDNFGRTVNLYLFPRSGITLPEGGNV